jgi:hypothetical protein
MNPYSGSTFLTARAELISAQVSFFLLECRINFAASYVGTLEWNLFDDEVVSWVSNVHGLFLVVCILYPVASIVLHYL